MAQDPDEVTGPGTPTLAAKAPSSALTIAEIRSQIVETRAVMTATIDAIQERLIPARLMTHAKEAMKEATVGRMKHLAQKARDTAGGFARQTEETRAAIVHKVKNNPVPVALVGVAATWLFVRALGRARTEADQRDEHGAERHGRRGGTNTLTGTVRNNAWFLIGAGTGVACWGIWKAQTSWREFRQRNRATLTRSMRYAHPSRSNDRQITRSLDTRDLRSPFPSESHHESGCHQNRLMPAR